MSSSLLSCKLFKGEERGSSRVGRGRRDVTAARFKEGRAHFGPAPEYGYLGCFRAQLDKVKVIVEMQCGVVRFGSAWPKDLVEKSQKSSRKSRIPSQSQIKSFSVSQASLQLL